jgi:hypothetical protein
MNYVSNFTEKSFFKSWQSLSWPRNSLSFVEPKGSSMWSKELTTRPQPEPANSSPHLHSNFLKIHINSMLPSMPRSELWLAHRLSLLWIFMVSLSCSRQEVLGYYLDQEIADFFQILSNSSITLPLDAIQSKSWQYHKITHTNTWGASLNKFFKHFLSLAVVLHVPSI